MTPTLHRPVARRRLLFGVVALVALTAAGGAWLTRGGVSSSSSGAVDLGNPWRLFEPGLVHRYRFSWKSEETVTPVAPPGLDASAAPPIDALLILDGVLEVRARDAGERPWRLSFVMTELERAELRVAGADVPDLADLLVGQELGVVVGGRGRFTHYLAPETTDPLVVQTLRALAMRVQLLGPEDGGAPSWRSTDTLPHGVAASAHRREGNAVERTRERYLSLDVATAAGVTPEVTLVAEASARLDDQGRLASLEDEERLTARHEGQTLLDGRHALSLLLLDTRPLLAPSDLSRWVSRPLAVVPTSGRMAERALEQRAEGMTTADVIQLLQRHMNGGRLPDHNKTLWRMAAVLELYPELARALLELFLDENATSKGRALLLDLLASVGHAEAQAALREALASEQGRADPSYGLLYQRLGLVEEPMPETLEMAREELASARQSGDLEQTMLKAYTAGAVAGHAEELPAERDAIADELGGMLASATSPTEQKHLVKALGNAQRPEDHEPIATYAESEDVGVRQAVARALKRPVTAVGLETLLVLAGDTDPFVQSEALRALRHYTLEAPHYAVLEGIVRSGRLHKRNQRTLLDLLKHDRARLPEATESVLRAMLELDLDGEVRGAVSALLSP